MIRLDNISKQNGHQILFIEASATLLKGEKAGLVGPNGAGKTTLFRMITGREKPDGGTLVIGKTVKLAAKTDQSQPLTWKSTTRRVCTVKRTFTGKGAKRRAIWTLRATRRKGACRLTATAPAKGLALATSFASTVTVF